MALKHEFSIVDKSYRGYEIFENMETKIDKVYEIC